MMARHLYCHRENGNVYNDIGVYQYIFRHPSRKSRDPVPDRRLPKDQLPTLLQLLGMVLVSVLLSVALVLTLLALGSVLLLLVPV
jgi:hypothetical protein